MNFRMIGALVSLLSLLLLAVTAGFPAYAEARRAPKASDQFECWIEHDVAGTHFEMMRAVRRDGTLVSRQESIGSDAPEHGTLRAQMAATLDRLALDPPANCTPAREVARTGRQAHGYDCAVHWSEGPDSFSFQNEHWNWSRDLGDGVRVSLNNPIPGAPHVTGAILPPFGERLPIFWVDQNHTGTNRIHGVDGVWTYRVATELRIGRKVFRKWAASNVMLSMEWSVWPQMMDGTGNGDITLLAYDTETGPIFRKTLPRDFLASVESGLKRGVARYRRAQLDPANQCKPGRSGADIVIID